ncbi:hypothetical protein [Streptomyces monashensis]|uniref:DUF2613 domain-containing protein n=1 Tax=Streptomyces monashensis TaxID=1678012 RepID=A0A1S2P9K2_9ACTN|nr:hypothetical protein [Streptomyces monashensis]OIJ90307.1 hypothetical protein BIV23_40750 [Streptomyces monashensis]
MLKFTRVAVVAAAFAGLSALGVGVSFAGGGEGAAPQITAAANSSAAAVATGADFYAPLERHGHSEPEQEDGQHHGGE